jgi:peptidoglycan/xylan/chitin deacetylase (PgdA/CDA1 family)
MKMSRARKIAKYLMALLLYYSGVLTVCDRLRVRLSRHPDFVILMYHRVLDDPESNSILTQPGMSVAANTFDRQLAWLKKRFRVVSLKQLSESLETKQRLANRHVVITFDDGWRDNYTNAFCLLRKHHLPAIVFLTAEYVGTNRAFWFLMVKWLLLRGNVAPDTLVEIISDGAGADPSAATVIFQLRQLTDQAAMDPDRVIEILKMLEGAALDKVVQAMLDKSNLSQNFWEKEKPMLSWEEVREMNMGGIEFGSHGCSHRILTLLPEGEIRNELEHSRAVIEEKLGRSVYSFSYPNGNYDEEVKMQVQRAGYTCAVTTSDKKQARNPVDRFALRRVAVHEGVTVGPTGRFSKAMLAWHMARYS